MPGKGCAPQVPLYHPRLPGATVGHAAAHINDVIIGLHGVRSALRGPVFHHREDVAASRLGKGAFGVAVEKLPHPHRLGLALILATFGNLLRAQPAPQCCIGRRAPFQHTVAQPQVAVAADSQCFYPLRRVPLAAIDAPLFPGPKAGAVADIFHRHLADSAID